MLELIDGVKSIVAERNSRNEANSTVPPVLPHELVMIRGQDFMGIVREQRARLLSRMSISQVDHIEQEFGDLLKAYRSEPAFKATLKGCDETTSFEDGWLCTGGRFALLRDFCGGLATVFPGTATVESDFSIVKYVKDDFKTQLTDLSLEGILHAKQFKQLRGIGTY